MMDAHFSVMDAVQETGELKAKPMKAVDAPREIEEFDVGTAAKDFVYGLDKVQIYHNNTDGPTTRKPPVIMVPALTNR